MITRLWSKNKFCTFVNICFYVTNTTLPGIHLWITPCTFLGGFLCICESTHTFVDFETSGFAHKFTMNWTPPPSTQATLTNRSMFLLQTILFCFKIRAVSPWNKLAHSSALAQIGNKVNKKIINARKSIIKLNYDH